MRKRINWLFLGMVFIALVFSGCSSGGGGSSSSSTTPRASSSSSSSSGGSSGGGGGGGGGGGSSLAGVASLALISGGAVIVEDALGTDYSGYTISNTGTDGQYTLPTALVDSLSADKFPLVISITGGTFPSGDANEGTVRTLIPASSFSSTMTANTWLGSEVLVSTYKKLGTTDMTVVQARAKAVLKALCPYLGDIIDGLNSDLGAVNPTPAASGNGLNVETLQTAMLKTLGKSHSGGLSASDLDAIGDIADAYNDAITAGSNPTTAVFNKAGALNSALAGYVSLSAYQNSDTFKAALGEEVSALTGASSATVQGMVTQPSNWNDPGSVILAQDGGDADPSRTTELVDGAAYNMNCKAYGYANSGADLAAGKLAVWWSSDKITPSGLGAKWATINPGADLDATLAADAPVGEYRIVVVAVDNHSVNATFTVKIVDKNTSATVKSVSLTRTAGNQWGMVTDSSISGVDTYTSKGMIPSTAESTASPTKVFQIAPSSTGTNTDIKFILSLQAPSGLQMKVDPGSGQVWSNNRDIEWVIGDGNKQISVYGLKTDAESSPGNKTFVAKVYRTSKTDSNLQASSSQKVYLLSDSLQKKVARIDDISWAGLPNRTMNAFEIAGRNGTFRIVDAKPAASINKFTGVAKTWGAIAGVASSDPTQITKMNLVLDGESSKNAGFGKVLVGTGESWNMEITGLTATWGTATSFSLPDMDASINAEYFGIKVGGGLANEEVVRIVIPKGTSQAKVASGGFTFKKK